jgi:hypothetical protein
MNFATPDAHDTYSGGHGRPFASCNISEPHTFTISKDEMCNARISSRSRYHPPLLGTQHTPQPRPTQSHTPGWPYVMRNGAVLQLPCTSVPIRGARVPRIGQHLCSPCSAPVHQLSRTDVPILVSCALLYDMLLSFLCTCVPILVHCCPHSSAQSVSAFLCTAVCHAALILMHLCPCILVHCCSHLYAQSVSPFLSTGVPIGPTWGAAPSPPAAAHTSMEAVP